MIFLDTNVILHKKPMIDDLLKDNKDLFKADWVFELKDDYYITHTVLLELKKQLNNLEKSIKSKKSIDRDYERISLKKISDTRKKISKLKVLPTKIDYEKFWNEFVVSIDDVNILSKDAKDWFINKEIDYFIENEKILITSNERDFKKFNRNNPLEIINLDVAQARFIKSAGIFIKLKAAFWEEYKDGESFGFNGDDPFVVRTELEIISSIFNDSGAKTVSMKDWEFRIFHNGIEIFPESEVKYKKGETFNVECKLMYIAETENDKKMYEFIEKRNIQYK